MCVLHTDKMRLFLGDGLMAGWGGRWLSSERVDKSTYKYMILTGGQERKEEGRRKKKTTKKKRRRETNNAKPQTN